MDVYVKKPHSETDINIKLTLINIKLIIVTNRDMKKKYSLMANEISFWVPGL